MIDKLDKTGVDRSSAIDSILELHITMKHIEGWKLIEKNKMTYSNYRSCISNAGFEEYFSN